MEDQSARRASCAAIRRLSSFHRRPQSRGLLFITLFAAATLAAESRAQTQALPPIDAPRFAPPQFVAQSGDLQPVYSQPPFAQPIQQQQPALQQQPPQPVQQVAAEQPVAEQLAGAIPSYAPSPIPQPALEQAPLYPIASPEAAAMPQPMPSEVVGEKSAPEIQINVPDFLAANFTKMQSGDPGLRAKVEGKPAKEWTDMSAEKWTVKLGGHVQLDYINWANASPNIVGANDYFEFRRLRLVADGAGYGVYDFRLQMTLEPETVGETPGNVVTSPDVKDAYFSLNEIPLLGRWRIGNFFVPFGLEQVTNDTNNVFLERSIPTQGIFTADREVGMAFYNCSDDQSITWTTGAFFDNISEGLKERIDDAQGYRLSGRTGWVPYYDEPSKGRYMFYVGSGVLFTEDQDRRVRFRARPQIHEGPRLIDSGVLAADKTTTINFESALVWGPFTLQGEAYASQVQFLNNTTKIVNGNYIHLSWFLTGENRIFERFGQHGAQFGRNQPFSNVFFVPGFRSWGAFEAKARWSRLDLTTIDAGQYNDFTLGFNWYWSDRTRVMFDWIHPLTPTGTLPFGATNADILAMRFDFNW
jgi:phosphate-selective porin